MGKSLNHNTFHDDFDKLISTMNFNETNGILIGSELSRIFSEIIFQSIDRKVMGLLEDKNNLYSGKDYKILRYVDDYFIYSNQEKDQKDIINTLQHVLSEFKLNLNTAKSEKYEKPIITNISIAKLKISVLLDEFVSFKLEEVSCDILTADGTKLKGEIYINIDNFILSFKSILKQNEVEYSQILNYTFSILQNKVEDVLKRYKKVDLSYRKPENLIGALLKLIDFCFFIYTVSPQVTTTIRLCRVVSEILFFIKKNQFNSDLKDQIYKLVFNNIKIVFEKNNINTFSQIETINLLLISDDLEGKYSFSKIELMKYFNLKIDCEGIESSLQELNYFSYTALLFYIKNNNKYNDLKTKICSSILSKIEKTQEKTQDLKNNAEYILLFFDLIACPYLDKDFKEKLLKSMYKPAIQNPIITENVIKYISERKWFISWGKINFRELLDKKIGLAVY